MICNKQREDDRKLIIECVDTNPKVGRGRNIWMIDDFIALFLRLVWHSTT